MLPNEVLSGLHFDDKALNPLKPQSAVNSTACTGLQSCMGNMCCTCPNYLHMMLYALTGMCYGHGLTRRHA